MNCSKVDPAIWQQFKRGDLAAFERIYTTFFNPLYTYGYRLCGHPELARDCVHDLFYKIWKNRESLAEVTAVKAYLYKAYRRTLLDLVQDQRRSLSDQELPSPYDLEFSAEEMLVQQQSEQAERERIAYVLNSLTKRQKEIIYLRFYKELSYEEIAEVLRINNQSVRNCVHDAITVLRQQIKHPLVLLFLPFIF
jgi:RNA polymerase sigma-70 factor (ECF subfamily)